jgi:hypothetical protein
MLTQSPALARMTSGTVGSVPFWMPATSELSAKMTPLPSGLPCMGRFRLMAETL